MLLYLTSEDKGRTPRDFMILNCTPADSYYDDFRWWWLLLMFMLNVTRLLKCNYEYFKFLYQKKKKKNRILEFFKAKKWLQSKICRCAYTVIFLCAYYTGLKLFYTPTRRTRVILQNPFKIHTHCIRFSSWNNYFTSCMYMLMRCCECTTIHYSSCIIVHTGFSLEHSIYSFVWNKI